MLATLHEHPLAFAFLIIAVGLSAFCGGIIVGHIPFTLLSKKRGEAFDRIAQLQGISLIFVVVGLVLFVMGW